MAKKILYRYNPDTDDYERAYPTGKERAVSALRYIACIGLGALIFYLIAYSFDYTPTQGSLRRQNSHLRAQYSLLKHRIEESNKVLDHLASRDDNLYRVMLQMEPVSRMQRYSGLGTDSRYRSLGSMSDVTLADELTREMDVLDRRIYAQSVSFDQVKTAITRQHNKLNHIPSVLPVSIKWATIACGFGYRREPVGGKAIHHTGLDLAAPIGTPVMATADGVVASAGWDGNAGNCVEINHGYNYKTRFEHLSSISVAKGDHVSRGDEIAKVGTSGKSAGAHLHYEVLFKDEPQNPVNYYFMDITPKQYSDLLKASESNGHVMD